MKTRTTHRTNSKQAKLTLLWRSWRYTRFSSALLLQRMLNALQSAARREIAPITQVRSSCTSSTGQKGFTLIELMIATTIFSIVLTVILASFLQIGRMFYKGVSVNNTNESTRTLIDDISNDVRLAQNPTATTALASNKYYFCIGDHRYTYLLNQQVTASNITNTNPNTMSAGVIEDTAPGCPTPSTGGTNQQQLLGPNMQLSALDFGCATTGCTLHAHVIYYGADDSVFISRSHPTDTPAQAINRADAQCSGNLLSTQFCAVADISTNLALKF